MRRTDLEKLDKKQLIQNILSYESTHSPSTVEHQLESALLQLDNQRDAMDAHAIIGITDQRGRITHINDQFCEVSGYRRGDLLGRTHNILNSNYHPKQFFAEMWKCIKDGNVWQGTIRNRRKDQSYYWVQTTIMPFKDITGKIVQFVSIRTDITDLINAREEGSHLNQKLELISERLRAEKHSLKNKNIALNEILNHVEDEKNALKLTIKRNFESIVNPLVAKLQHRGGHIEKQYLDLLTKNLSDIATPFFEDTKHLDTRLTPKELEICSMIKNGLSVKEIATIMYLSPRTVGKHRENIRKKLDLKSKKINLVSYLQAHF